MFDVTIVSIIVLFTDVDIWRNS